MVASSRNSSQPSLRDCKTDAPTGKRRRKKKRGAQPGHPKTERPLVEKPDTVIEVRVPACANCGADLQVVAPVSSRRSTTTPEALRPLSSLM